MGHNLAAILTGQLVHAGADTIFGVPGGGSNLEVIGAAEQLGMRFVLTHTETAGCIAASTYGLVAGQPGVAIATRGPGIASAVNGAAQATLDRSPLVLVSDTVARAQAARVTHQRIDQTAMLRPVTKWSGTLGTRDPQAVADAATRLAVTGPAGAVHLDVDASTDGAAPPAVPVSPGPSPTAEDVQRAQALVAAARRPVLVIGQGAIGQTAEVRDLARRLGCPALMTYQAAGVVPMTSPAAGPLFTNGAAEGPLLDEADLVIAIGVDAVELRPADWTYPAPVIRLAAWPMDPDYFDAEVSLTGDLGGLLSDLMDNPVVAVGDWATDAGAQLRRSVADRLRIEVAGLAPHAVVEAVREAAPPGTRFTVDAGAHMLVTMPLLAAEDPFDVLISNGLATMGFAVPAAIGAALADPHRPVVAFVGDGGLGMSLAELETIQRYSLPITVVVFNDATLSLIRIKQQSGQGAAGAVAYRTTDFAQVAHGVGMAASVATSAAQVAAAAGGAVGPALVDARIDGDGYGRAMTITRG